MQSELPNWVQWLQALSVPSIALFAAIIGWLQWLTANRKVVVDLFDRRLTAYSEIRSAVALINRTGQVDFETELQFWRAIDSARFLFGREVWDYLDNLRLKLIDLD